MTAPRPVTPLGIVAATLSDLVTRAEAPDGVDDGFRAELRRVSELAAGLDPYVEACTTPESPALQALSARTHAEDWTRHSGAVFLEQEMLSGHVEGQALKFLVHATRATRVLEIGMFTGYSALAMAEALPVDGTVVACELDPFVADLARSCFAASADGAKIEVRVGPASDSLKRLADEAAQFDLVFIDADKAGYAGYLDTLLSTGLLAPGALIAVDNTLMQGLPWATGERSTNGTAIADFNRGVAEDPRVEQVLLPVRDGLTLIRRAGDANRTEQG